MVQSAGEFGIRRNPRHLCGSHDKCTCTCWMKPFSTNIGFNLEPKPTPFPRITVNQQQHPNLTAIADATFQLVQHQSHQARRSDWTFMSCVVAHETPATARVTPPLENCQVRIERLPLWGPQLWVPNIFCGFRVCGSPKPMNPTKRLAKPTEHIKTYVLA